MPKREQIMIEVSEERKKELYIKAKKEIKAKNIRMDPETFEALVTKLYKEYLNKEINN